MLKQKVLLCEEVKESVQRRVLDGVTWTWSLQMSLPGNITTANEY
jgi:hypothetical protein